MSPCRSTLLNFTLQIVIANLGLIPIQIFKSRLAADADRVEVEFVDEVDTDGGGGNSDQRTAATDC